MLSNSCDKKKQTNTSIDMNRRKKRTKRQFSLVVVDRNSIFDSVIRTISVRHTDAAVDDTAGLVVVRERNSTACTTNEDRNSLGDGDVLDGDDDDGDDEEKCSTGVHVRRSVEIES